MERAIRELAEGHFDLLVIGGGINGLAIAWEASLRGLHVALVEREDFGAKTSSASLKIVHGGLRYLQHLDLRRMRESIRERSTLLHVAPHLVYPLPFLVPTYGHLLKGPELMAAAVIANEIISLDRNQFLRDPARRLPCGRIFIPRAECRGLVPGLPEKGLNGGVLFYDAQMYSAERLNMAFALSAAEQGAVLVNYAEVTGFERQGGRITAAVVRDAINGGEFGIPADVYVNATGPWSDIVLGLLESRPPPRVVRRSKGIQIVAPPLTRGTAVALPSRHRDPAALFSRGTRHYFITPWRGVSLIGTTDTVYEGDPDHFRITRDDIREFVTEVGQILPSAKLDPDSIPFAFGGLRPITEKNIEAATTTARKYEINDHRKDPDRGNLITVIGVKYTTCRLLAEKVINLVFRKMNRRGPLSRTARTPLVGGEIDDWQRFVSDMEERWAGRLPSGAIRHMAHCYGTRAREVAGLAQENGDLAQLVPGSDEVIAAQVVHAVRAESAVRLADVVMRRTDLGSKGHPGRAALEFTARLMARELGWSDARLRHEIADTERLFVFTPG